MAEDQDDLGWIEVTIVRDSANGVSAGQMLVAALSNLASVGESPESSTRCRIVLRETIPFSTPWVFRDPDQQAPPRELIVAESYADVKRMMTRAKVDARIFSKADLDEYDKGFSVLRDPLPIKPPVKIVRNRTITLDDD